MDLLENHGIIIRELRTRAGFSVQKTAKMIQKSAGWLSEIESGRGTCRLTSTDFEHVIGILKGTSYRPMFKTWIANHKNQEKISKAFDGAVLKHIRSKKERGLTLTAAAKQVGISKGYLSRLEKGACPMTLKLRIKIMKAYGYNPSSFKNLSSDPVRSKAVPTKYKFDIFLRTLTSEEAEKLFQQVLTTKI
jgi:transcriptional regulator with XRE-family HTH domain